MIEYWGSNSDASWGTVSDESSENSATGMEEIDDFPNSGDVSYSDDVSISFASHFKRYTLANSFNSTLLLCKTVLDQKILCVLF
jgi:hypothetical protein